jgi:hypothetical protein
VSYKLALYNELVYDNLQKDCAEQISP